MDMHGRLLREVRRLRHADPYLSIKSAYELARWRVTAPTRDDGDSWDEDGFTLRVRTEYDDEPYDGDDVPRFINARDITPAERREVVSVRGFMWADDDYAETPYWSRGERIASYRARGASRSVAVERAEADMLREISESRGDGYITHVVIVTASREGLELGRGVLGGVTFGTEYGDACRYLAEVSGELSSEAIAEAQSTLARLCRTGE